jgi:poly-gamma-glutamate synthesis protein (capsule biosynthesis protein)
VAALALAVLLGACSSGDAPRSAATAPATAVPSGPTETPAPTTAAPDPRVPGPDWAGSGNAVTIAFGGDVHFEGASRSALSGGLRPITPLLSAADVTMVNLETAITERGEKAPKDYNFRAPATAFRALRSAGVDVVTVANNHGQDYGVTGLRDTLQAAKDARFPLVGAGLDDDQAFAPWRTTVKGQRLAFFGVTHVLDSSLQGAWTARPGKPGLASAYEEERLLRAVREARAAADTVVVYLHWGTERRSCPNDRQLDIAPKLAAAGADIVVGSHAHVLLGAGMLKRTLVAYGLGNFVFYARGGAGAQTGVLTVTVTGRRVGAYRWDPAVIGGGVPRPLAGDEAAAARRRWEALRACTGLTAR